MGMRATFNMKSTTTVSSLVRTVLGPLTTVFTPPPSCSRVFFGSLTDITYGPLSAGWQAQSCAGTAGWPRNFQLDASCWPPGMPAFASVPWPNWAVYSPGRLCPAGYTKAWMGTTGIGDLPVAAGETVIGCCPSGYTTTEAIGVVSSGPVSPDTHFTAYLICASRVWTTGPTEVRQCDSHGKLMTTTITLPLAGNATPGVWYDLDLTVYVSIIPYVWRAQDLETIPRATATATAMPETSPVSTDSRTLSAGAAAGIGIAGFSVLIALLALGVWAFRRKRRQQRNEYAQRPPSNNGGVDTPKAELSGDGHLEAHELRTVEKPQELVPVAPRNEHENGAGPASTGVGERPPAELEA